MNSYSSISHFDNTPNIRFIPYVILFTLLGYFVVDLRLGVDRILGETTEPIFRIIIILLSLFLVAIYNRQPRLSKEGLILLCIMLVFFAIALLSSIWIRKRMDSRYTISNL